MRGSCLRLVPEKGVCEESVIVGSWEGLEVKGCHDTEGGASALESPEQIAVVGCGCSGDGAVS